MRSAALVEEAGARGRVVSLKTEAGTVTGMMSTGDTRGDILKIQGQDQGRLDLMGPGHLAIQT